MTLNALAAGNLAHGEHGRLQGVDAAADHGLELDNGLRGHDNRVDALMRQRAMRAAPDDLHLELVGGSPQRTAPDHRLPQRAKAPDVQPKGCLRLGALQHAIGDHGTCPLGDLLGWLEHELDPTSQLVLPPGQQGRHAQPDGGVAIVTAGMHLARVLRGKGQTSLLVNRQRVHVKTQQDGRAGMRALQDGHYTGLANSAAHLKPQVGQRRGHHTGGAELLKGSFRVTMQVAPPAHQLIHQRVGVCQNRRSGCVHGNQRAACRSSSARLRRAL